MKKKIFCVLIVLFSGSALSQEEYSLKYMLGGGLGFSSDGWELKYNIHGGAEYVLPCGLSVFSSIDFSKFSWTTHQSFSVSLSDASNNVVSLNGALKISPRWSISPYAWSDSAAPTCERTIGLFAMPFFNKQK